LGNSGHFRETLGNHEKHGKTHFFTVFVVFPYFVRVFDPVERNMGKVTVFRVFKRNFGFEGVCSCLGTDPCGPILDEIWTRSGRDLSDPGRS
jgi:hypothetical protein